MATGRNEPCPCGSGKKYKHCCLRAGQTTAAHTTAAQAMLLRQTGFSTMAELQAAMDRYGQFCESQPDNVEAPSFMEFLGKRSPVSDLTRQIRGEMEDRTFGSQAELQEFLHERMSSINDAPRADFEGLSPAQMHEILHARDTEELPLLRFSESLSASTVETAPLVATILWLLRYHADHGGGTPLTARDNYPRVLCHAYLSRFMRSFRDGMSVPNEESLPNLVLAHDIVVDQGWADEERQWSELTAAGKGAADGTDGSAAEVFHQVFSFMLFSDDWSDHPGDEYDIIQSSAIFSLYLLSRYPEGTVAELFQRFARAFPEFVKPAQGDKRRLAWLEELFTDMFLRHFCVSLGLVTLSDRYRTTELFRAAFSWG